MRQALLSLMIGCCAVAAADQRTLKFSMTDGSQFSGRLIASEVAGQIAAQGDWFSGRLELKCEQLFRAESGDAIDTNAGILAFVLNDQRRFVGPA